MKKLVIGLIYSGRGVSKDEKIFLELAKEKDIELVMFNTSRYINEKKMEEKALRCKVIYNSSAEDYAMEIVKTFERLGIKVLDSSISYYYSEDKWVFYLHCRERKLPVPRTILLSENISLAKKELEAFNQWPVILKRVMGTMGEFVDRAKNMEEAEKVMKKFWKKGKERFPIIAQEFIKSPSYRVTVIDKKIIQTIIKENKGWKTTGNYAKKFKKFEVDNKLRKIIKKVMRISKIKICGIDFLQQGKKWIVLEINAEPELGFIEEERKLVVGKVFDLLIKEARARKR